MKRFFTCLLALIATSFSEDVDLEKGFFKENDKFTAKFFNELVNLNPEKSVIMSAFSVLQPLALLSLGSVGETHDEILNVIGIPNDNVTKAVFPLVNRNLESVKGVVLKQANRVYIPLGVELDDQLEATSKNVFGSEIKNADFTNSQQTANAINGWVEDQTNKRIKNIVSPASITASTELILVNAIYFKGSWEEPFDKSNTKELDYHVNKDVTIKKPIMYRHGSYSYGESKALNSKLLEIFYDGRESSFLIVLPNDVEGLTILKTKLKEIEVLDEEIQKMKTEKVHVYIPKFKIETSTNLVDVLKAVGVKSLFGKAQLEKLLKGHEKLSVSSAIQKAFIEVDEEGAEAAAANVFAFGSRPFIDLSPIYEFKADKPFYFELRVKEQRLFNGIFYQ